MKYSKLNVFLFIFTAFAAVVSSVAFYADHKIFDFVLGLVNGALAVYWFKRVKVKK